MKDASSASLAGLQIMRAIAALLVTAHHAMLVVRQWTPGETIFPDWLVTAGASGVDIFFVISGFIMMTVSFPTASPPIDPSTFLLKRLARIYPFYWVVAGLVLLIWQFVGSNSLDAYDPSPSEIVRSLLLLPSETLLLPISWTLVLEMNFYVLFAATLLGRRALVSLISVTSLLVLQLALGDCVSDPAARDFLTKPIVLEFCFGMALGLAYLRGKLNWHVPWSVVAAALTGMIGAPLVVPPEALGGLDPWDRIWAWGVPAVVLVAACISWPVGEGHLGRIGMLLGNASYAIYLLHPLVMMAYGKLFHLHETILDDFQLLGCLAAIVLSAGLGVAAHVTIERPLTSAARWALLSLARRSKRAANPT